jgi:hypothetical protein
MGKEGPVSGYLTILNTAAQDQLYFSFSFVCYSCLNALEDHVGLCFHSMKNISGS